MRKILVSSILAISLSAIPALAQSSATIRDAQQVTEGQGF